MKVSSFVIPYTHFLSIHEEETMVFSTSTKIALFLISIYLRPYVIEMMHSYTLPIYAYLGYPYPC